MFSLSEPEFNENVLSKARVAKGIDNCWFVVFYSNMSDVCLYVIFEIYLG
jgi:hypothetical protein